MTDLEKFVELYKSFGIECIVNDNKDGNKIIYLGESIYSGIADKATAYEKLYGYSCYSEVVFDSNGCFLEQGFWQ